MKAIKNFISILVILPLINACKDKNPDVIKLDPSTKSYFEIKDNSVFVFTDVSDTNVTIVYNSSNYVNSHANPDIENNEIMTFDMNSAGNKTYTIRSESGGLQFKDRIAMLTKFNDSIVIGPVIFNLGGVFSVGFNSGDSVTQYSSFDINGKTFTDVVKVKPKQNLLYKEVYFAKNIGLIARKEKNDKFYYLKRYSVNQ